MAKAPNVKVHMDLDLTPAIARLEVLAGIFMDMGEAMIRMGEEISNTLVTLQLQEMTK